RCSSVAQIAFRSRRVHQYLCYVLCADAMRRTKARLSLPSLSFVHNWERRRLTNGSSNPLDSFRKYSPLRVGAEQEVLAVGDPVSGSGAAEPLSNRRRGRRRADGEAH